MTFLPLRFVPIAPPGFPNFEFAIWDENVLISETKLTDTYYSIFLFFTKKIVFQNDEQAEVRWKQWEQWEKSFQVLNILDYFSHDPVIGNQDSI